MKVEQKTTFITYNILINKSLKEVLHFFHTESRTITFGTLGMHCIDINILVVIFRAGGQDTIYNCILSTLTHILNLKGSFYYNYLSAFFYVIGKNKAKTTN